MRPARVKRKRTEVAPNYEQTSPVIGINFKNKQGEEEVRTVALKMTTGYL